jgi:beta-glucosidase
MFKYLGCATASHQIEGYTDNDWSRWEIRHANRLASSFNQVFSHLPEDIFHRVKNAGQNSNNYISGVGADHYRLWQDDLNILRDLKLNSYRFSIEWSRVEPKRGVFNHEAVEFYKAVVQKLLDMKVEPFLTLWHFTTPNWIVESGDFFNKKNREAFVKYAVYIVSELKKVNKDLKYIVIFNEPSIYSVHVYITRDWLDKASLLKAIRAPFLFASLYKEVYTALKEKFPDLQISIAKNIILTKAVGMNPFGYINSAIVNVFHNLIWLDLIRSKLDWIGINFYSYNIINGFRLANKNDKVSDLGWGLMPDKIYDAIMTVWNRYGKPIIITENGLADATDRYRRWFIKESIKGLKKSINDGAQVDGYLHWSLLDNFEWDKGFWPRFGLVEVDYTTKKRSIRQSAYALFEYAHKLLEYNYNE